MTRNSTQKLSVKLCASGESLSFFFTHPGAKPAGFTLFVLTTCALFRGVVITWVALFIWFLFFFGIAQLEFPFRVLGLGNR